MVQVHSYLKKQWGEIEQRIKQCEKQRVNKQYVKHLTLAAIKADDWHTREQCDMEVKVAVQCQVEQEIKNLDHHTNDIKEAMTCQADQYMREIKEYMETAAKLFQEDLMKCSGTQQATIIQLVDSLKNKQDTIARERSEHSHQEQEHNPVPTQVEIHKQRVKWA